MNSNFFYLYTPFFTLVYYRAYEYEKIDDLLFENFDTDVYKNFAIVDYPGNI